MISTLTAEGLIENWVQSRFDGFNYECTTAHWDCQDTDCDNSTECYFYYPEHLSEDTIRKYGSELCEMLGVDKDAYSYEFNAELDEWRISVIVTISVLRDGRNLNLVPDVDIPRC